MPVESARSLREADNGFDHQEAPQEDAQAQAQEAAEEDALAAPAAEVALGNSNSPFVKGFSSRLSAFDLEVSPSEMHWPVESPRHRPDTSKSSIFGGIGGNAQ